MNSTNIKLSMPHKIVPLSLKRYEAHYLIPALYSLIVPLKDFGDEVSCDIRWLDRTGQFQLLQNKIFINENLVPINPLMDDQLYEMWSQHYKQKSFHASDSPDKPE